MQMCNGKIITEQEMKENKKKKEEEDEKYIRF